MSEATCEYTEMKGLFRKTARMCARKADWRLVERSTPPWETIPVCGEHLNRMYNTRRPEARIDWTVRWTERDSEEFLKGIIAPPPEGSRAAEAIAKMEMQRQMEETLKYDPTDESSVLDAARQIVGDGTLFVVRAGGGFAIDYEPAANNARCVMVTAERVAFIGEK